MPMRDRARWAFVILLSMALLSAPAIWNHFPLLQYDTGGYLARWYEPYLVPSRAVTYGLILNAGAVLSFWPVVLGQSALTVWVIALILRVHGLGGRPGLLAGIVAALSVFSTLPWLTSILLTDIFAGLAVLALYLLLLRANDLTGREQAGLVALIAVSVATHRATFAVLLMLLAAAALLSLVAPSRLPRRRLGNGALATALGAALVFAANATVTKRLTWTPGGFALSFGRMRRMASSRNISTSTARAHASCSALTKTNCRAMPTNGSGAARCSTSSDASPALMRRWNASPWRASPNIRCYRSKPPP